MARKLSREDRQALKDAEWWKSFAAHYGWKLHGFSYRASASFFKDGHHNAFSVDGPVLEALLQKAGMST